MFALNQLNQPTQYIVVIYNYIVSRIGPVERPSVASLSSSIAPSASSMVTKQTASPSATVRVTLVLTRVRILKKKQLMKGFLGL